METSLFLARSSSTFISHSPSPTRLPHAELGDVYLQRLEDQHQAEIEAAVAVAVAKVYIHLHFAKTNNQFFCFFLFPFCLVRRAVSWRAEYSVYCIRPNAIAACRLADHCAGDQFSDSDHALEFPFASGSLVQSLLGARRMPGRHYSGAKGGQSGCQRDARGDFP